MPISPITLQRRHAELGRIRLGDQRPVGDKGRTRPNKLDRFRFTSVSERYIRDLATLYGGEARPWDNKGIASWEVYSEARSIPVIVVKGGLSQWMETWAGGGCVHRCDGQQQVDGTPCDPRDDNHTAAKPTTRLSLMLVELEAIGVWRCETHGWNAAAEIPAVAELAQFVGDLVPANLHLSERRAVKDGKTSRFVVPVLDLQIGTERLKEIVAQKSGQAAPELGGAGGGHQQLEAPRPDYVAQANAAATVDEWRLVWDAAREAGHLTPELKSALGPIGSALNAASAPPADQPPPEPDAEGVYDADVVDDQPSAEHGDPDTLWQQILTVGGQLNMTLADVNDEYAAHHDGNMPDSVTAQDLAGFLAMLREQVAA